MATAQRMVGWTSPLNFSQLWQVSRHIIYSSSSFLPRLEKEFHNSCCWKHTWQMKILSAEIISVKHSSVSSRVSPICSLWLCACIHYCTNPPGCPRWFPVMLSCCLLTGRHPAGVHLVTTWASLLTHHCDSSMFNLWFFFVFLLLLGFMEKLCLSL